MMRKQLLRLPSRSINMNPAIRKSALIIFLLAALFAAGVAVRRTVLIAQYENFGRPLPFDLESALSFRYVRLLALTGRLPGLDRGVQYPEGVVIRRTYEIGMEYICAGLASLFPAAVPLDERVRWITALWFCLGIPALFLWLWWWQGSLVGATAAGLFYAVSIASVLRATGQELSHENFALPLLIAHLALQALADRPAPRFSARLGLPVLSAVFLALALMLWDLIQFYIIIWAVLGGGRVLAGNYFAESRRRLNWGAILAALLLAGLLNPYLRAHGFLYSPAVLLACGVLLAAPLAGQRKYFLARAGLALLPLTAGLVLGRPDAFAYGHFAELLWAKILFLNAKPADPALLTFAQRILWVPALNSANILLTKNLFPVSLLLFLIAAFILIFNPRWRADPKVTELLLFGGISLIAFVLFVRLHVFAAIAFAAGIGLLAVWAARRKNILIRVLALLLICGGAAGEAANVLRNPVRWGSGQPYLPERKELVAWLQANAGGQPVLANFGISAFVRAYTDCPIILHPKFEAPAIRKRVQAYGEKLFKGDEAALRAWAGQYGAAFYIYSLGEFADQRPAAQMRYFVDALNPPPWAAARLFEFHPLAARWFRLVWQNRKYRVFRIITAGDEQAAEAIAQAAQRKIAQRRPEEAQRAAEQALLYDPANKTAQEAILQLEALRQRPKKNN